MRRKHSALFARQLSEGGDQFPVRPAAGSKAIAPLSCEWPFAVGNMLSYIARASLMRCARSSSDFGTNRTTSPMGFSKSKIRTHTWLWVIQIGRPASITRRYLPRNGYPRKKCPHAMIGREVCGVIGHDDGEIEREKERLIASGVVRPGDFLLA